MRLKYAAKGTHLARAKKKTGPPRNLLGNVWNLNFFVSNEERRKYDKQRTALKKTELAATAVITTETDALAKLKEQHEKCATDTQKKTLMGIMRRRTANLELNESNKRYARKQIREVEIFLRAQVWTESIDQVRE